MKEVKCELINNNGLRCMLCGKEVPYRQINYHHIKPKYASKLEGEEPDNSYANASLLCVTCHAVIHQYKWEDSEYQRLTSIILQNKK